jgi:hypothetical protein
VGAEIHIYCPGDKGGAGHLELWKAIEAFFGNAGKTILCDTLAGSGRRNFNIELELGDDANWEQWVVRLRAFLRQQAVQPGANFRVFPPEREPGGEGRLVEVYDEGEAFTDDSLRGATLSRTRPPGEKEPITAQRVVQDAAQDAHQREALAYLESVADVWNVRRGEEQPLSSAERRAIRGFLDCYSQGGRYKSYLIESGWEFRKIVVFFCGIYPLVVNTSKTIIYATAKSLSE